MMQAVEGELGALRERVKKWRKGRTSGLEPIPEELWNAAVEVARVEGVSATSRALRFSCTGLRERVNRVQAMEREDRAEGREAPAFVELGAGALGGVGTTIVEMVGRSGGRMRLELRGTSGVDVMGLVQAFWRHEA